MEMDRVKVALTVVSLTAFALLLTSEYRRRRRLRGRKLGRSVRSLCYLHSDQKPQLSFKRVLADNSYSQFKHFKRPNSGNKSTSHPYESEINALIQKPRLLDIEFGDCGDLGMGDSYIWVETESQLNDLVVALSKERIIAVDTEQHSLRSFLGFTSLVQISTKCQDYLVDTIALHDVMSVLRPVFVDPNICKVFHGADNDVLWLQRDFHLYVVNMFDTAKACELLSKPYKSLAYLLETYCGVVTNKLLQREDWRQRPLSAEMLEYARTDAHYLLHIAGCLISELKQLSSDNSLESKTNFLIEASRRSNLTCLQLYSKETEAPPGESAAISIFSRHFNGQGGLSISYETQDLVRRLCAWRDLMARIHDESLRFVLSDQSIVLLATEVPKTQTELCNIISQANLNGDSTNNNGCSSSPSPVVYCHLDDLYFLIQEKVVDFESAFQEIFEKCLGPDGGCPLSIYNYSLLLKRDMQSNGRTVSKQNGFRHPKKRIAKKASRELFVQKFSCKAPVYHNCRIFANDGRLLCYCDRRKLEWYLHRDLAKLVDDDPPAIMLLFEPKGRPEDEGNDFYIQSKKNICVSCGEGSHYLRYRVIPSCYRMHFPEHLKSHRSHDIVLLCVDCHEVAHAAAEKYKKQIAAEFQIPLFVRKVVDSEEQTTINWHETPARQADEAGVSPLHLRTAAMALLRHGLRMPADRRRELTQIIKQYYGGRELTEEDLEKALLVGMSPQERRKFEKKKRSSSKHSAGGNLSDKKPTENVTSEEKSSSDCSTKIDASSESKNLRRTEPACIEENNGANEETDSKDVDSEFAEDNCEEPSLETASNLHSPGHVSETSKDKLKSSLLGHGPHGKQVVNHILQHHGENGVSEFCQRWRKVFVEATHPRFLPAGWDIMHSGRRDFGEYSVYNPSKKADAT